MLPLLAFLVGQLPDVPQPPRLRTILPNGATILVERAPGAKRIYARLLLSARGAEETPTTHGMRHLLEHLVATGRDGRIDERLEREGAVLRAQTFRDATEFAVDAPGGKLSLALGALGEMLGLRAITAEEIAREAGVMRQEAAVQEVPVRLSAAAWRVAYGDRGLDPAGSLDVIRTATPASVAALHRRLCVGSNLVMVVVGDVNLDKTTAAVAPFLRSAPRVETKWTARPLGKGGRDDDAKGFGEVRALPVPAYDEPRTAAALAAALALASNVDNAFVLYTPSGRPGMVVLGQTQENSGLVEKVDGADPAALWERGKPLARGWLKRQTGDPGANASLRGLLLAGSTGDTPDAMAAAIEGLTYEDFAKAVAAFKGPGAVSVTGW